MLLEPVLRIPDVRWITVDQGVTSATGGDGPFKIVILQLMAHYALAVHIVGYVVQLQKELRSTALIFTSEPITDKGPPPDLSVVVIIQRLGIVRFSTPLVLQSGHSCYQ